MIKSCIYDIIYDKLVYETLNTYTMNYEIYIIFIYNSQISFSIFNYIKQPFSLDFFNFPSFY